MKTLILLRIKGCVNKEVLMKKMTSMAIPKAMQNGWSQSIFVLSELFLPTETLTERVHAR